MTKTNFQFLTVIAMMVFSVSACVENDSGNDSSETEVAAYKAIDVANMDTTVNPGDNFFLYANGGWIKNNPIPEEKSRYGAFDELQEANNEHLKVLIDELTSQEQTAGSEAAKIADFFATGMDTMAIDQARITPLNSLFEKIEAVQNTQQLANTMAYLQTYGVSPVFYIFSGQDKTNSENVIAYLWQGGLGLPDRDYYLDEGETYVKMRESYLEYLQKMFALMGDDEATAKANAQLVMDMETRIAKASNTNLENRDEHATYNPMDLVKIQEFAANIDWKNYFQNVGAPQVETINIAQPEFLNEVNAMMTDVPVDNWKTFLRWKLVNSMASHLSSDFETAHFDFYSRTLSGQTKMEPRWKRILKTVNSGMGMAVGKLYVEKHFPPEAKQRMMTLVDNLKKALSQRIEQLEWMTPETKALAQEKLETMNVKIGYPDKWRSYERLEIGNSSYAENVLSARRFAMQYELDKIGEEVDRDEWGMNPQTVNAYYSPSMNEIVFPAAILQPPFFFLNGDDAVNYGAIGVVIGHEMTHGFDDQGRLYDKDGNMKNWWTSTDSLEFSKRTQLLVEQYNDFAVELGGETYSVNGNLTLGENIADFGGLTIAYEAFKMTEQGQDNENIDDFTPDQRFFLAYAQVWRQNIRDEYLIRLLREDVHSPGRFRVNGALFNVPQFYEAFNIKEGALVRNDEQRPEIW